MILKHKESSKLGWFETVLFRSFFMANGLLTAYHFNLFPPRGNKDGGWKKKFRCIRSFNRFLKRVILAIYSINIPITIALREYEAIFHDHHSQPKCSGLPQDSLFVYLFDQSVHYRQGYYNYSVVFKNVLPHNCVLRNERIPKASFGWCRPHHPRPTSCWSPAFYFILFYLGKCYVKRIWKAKTKVKSIHYKTFLRG